MHTRFTDTQIWTCHATTDVDVQVHVPIAKPARNYALKS